LFTEARLSSKSCGTDAESAQALAELQLCRLHGQLKEDSLASYWGERFERHEVAIRNVARSQLDSTTDEHPATAVTRGKMPPDVPASLSYLEKLAEEQRLRNLSQFRIFSDDETPENRVPLLEPKYHGLAGKILKIVETLDRNHKPTKEELSARQSIK